MSDPVTIHVGDVREGLAKIPAGTVQCCVTSPPYWGLRDYGVEGQIGLEATPEAFVAKMVEVFAAVRRVLRDDGTLWLNIGDSYTTRFYSHGSLRSVPVSDGDWCKTGQRGAHGTYAPPESFSGLKPKDLCMMPWRVALALQADGWWIRSVIVWHKRSPMPESVTDRPTSAWEPIFLLAKQERYFYDAEAVKEKSSEGTNARGPLPTAMPKTLQDGQGFTKNNRSFMEATWAQLPTRNQRNVWTLSSEPFSASAQIVQWIPVEAGACGDDIRRTESPNCPVHGCRGSRRDDEHAGDSPNRTHGTGARLGQEQSHEQEASSPSRDASVPACSSDSLRPDSCGPASPNSTESRRTDPALWTNAPCTPSAQTDDGTPRTSESPEPCDLAEHTSENRIEEDSARDVQDSSFDQRIGRSGGTCTCQYHRRVTKDTSHFATFPSEIPRRAIMAGTSEKGCCPACGAPWMRVVERTDEEDPTAKGSRFDAGKTSGRTGGDRAQAGARMLKKPVGWAPGCDCNAGEPVPCLVLDPFLGSGTTIAVARQLGRHGVGCELNPEYVELAKVRIGKAEKPHTFQDTREEDAPLFGTLREVSP